MHAVALFPAVDPALHRMAADERVAAGGFWSDGLDGLFARVERLFDVEAFRGPVGADRRLRVGRRSGGAANSPCRGCGSFILVGHGTS